MMLTLEGTWIRALKEMCPLFLWHLTQPGRADSQFETWNQVIFGFLLVCVYYNNIIQFKIIFFYHQ